MSSWLKSAASIQKHRRSRPEWDHNFRRAFYTLASIIKPITTEKTFDRQTIDETTSLLGEILGKVYWEEGLGYRLDIELERQYYPKSLTLSLSTTTGISARRNRAKAIKQTPRDLVENDLGAVIGSAHRKNPKNLVLAIAPSFGHFAERGTCFLCMRTNPTPHATSAWEVPAAKARQIVKGEEKREA